MIMTPTSRLERGRYVLLAYDYERNLQEDELRKIFTIQLNRLFGIKGSLQMGIFLSWVHSSKPLLIFRASHKKVLDFFCICFFITNFENKDLSIIPLKTSGSIKNLQDEASKTNWNNFKEQM